MIITITDIDNPVRLQNNIDNRNCEIKIGIRKLIYYNMQYNVKNCRIIEIKAAATVSDSRVRLLDGAYTFSQLKKAIEKSAIDININVDPTTGIVYISILGGSKVYLNDPLKNILGFSTNWLIDENNQSEKHLNLKPNHMYIYLEQLSTRNNLVDGNPSNLLDVIQAPSVPFGGVTTIEFSYPVFNRGG